jgi:hypothetical protein
MYSRLSNSILLLEASTSYMHLDTAAERRVGNFMRRQNKAFHNDNTRRCHAHHHAKYIWISHNR